MTAPTPLAAKKGDAMSKGVQVYGASDDLIEVQGDVNEEFGAYDSGEGKERFLAFSDGTVLGVRYGNDGEWRVRLAQRGAGSVTIYPAGDAMTKKTCPYSDLAVLTGPPIRWVVMGEGYANA